MLGIAIYKTIVHGDCFISTQKPATAINATGLGTLGQPQDEHRDGPSGDTWDEAEKENGVGIDGLQGENLGARPGPRECYTNDDVPERGYHHDLRLLLVRLSADGLGQAAWWGVSFCQACAFVSVHLFCCSRGCFNSFLYRP